MRSFSKRMLQMAAVAAVGCSISMLALSPVQSAGQSTDQAPMQTSGPQSAPSNEVAPGSTVAGAGKPAGKITPPKLTHYVEPVYPSSARRKAIGGTVVVDLYVNDKGLPEQVRVKKGPQELEKAAAAAVSQYKFKPAMQDGKPVGTNFTVDVNFIATAQPSQTNPLMNAPRTHGMG